LRGRARDRERIHRQLKYFCNRLKSKLLYILTERGIKYFPSTVEMSAYIWSATVRVRKEDSYVCKYVRQYSPSFTPQTSAKSTIHMPKKSRNAVLLWVSCGVQAHVQAKL